MKPVRPEELSALLDGELDAGRAHEVREQMLLAPELRAEYEALSALDSVWRGAADSAAFTPDVRLVAGGSREDTAPGLGALGLFIAALIVVRVVLKLVGSDALTLALPVISLALVIGAIVWTAVAQRPVTEAAANPH